MNRCILMIFCFLAFIKNANALSSNIMFNCAPDYFQYCSQYPVNGDDVKDCFKKIGKNLKPYCIAALKKEGLITTEENKVEEKVKSPETNPYMEENNKEQESDKINMENEQESNKTIISKIKNRISSQIQTIKTKIKNKFSKKTETNKSEKVNKWEGYPSYLEWKTNRKEIGGEITPYGLEDRK